MRTKIIAIIVGVMVIGCMFYEYIQVPSFPSYDWSITDEKYLYIASANKVTMVGKRHEICTVLRAVWDGKSESIQEYVEENYNCDVTIGQRDYKALEEVIATERERR